MDWEWSDLVRQYRFVFTIDLLRYGIAASLSYFLVWHLFARQLGHRYIQKKRPAARQHWNEIKYSISSVAIYALVAVGIFIGNRHGVFHIYGTSEIYGTGYFIFSLVLLIFWHDTYFYWTHKWMHHPKIYKHVHRIHHKSVSPSPWTAYSFHPYEAIVQTLFVPIFLLVVPIQGYALALFMVYQIARNVVGHLGHELFHNAFVTNKFFNWITTTTHHDQHHHYFNHNYGLYFTWWDKWMKTEHPHYKEEFLEVKNRKATTADAGTSKPAKAA